MKKAECKTPDQWMELVTTCRASGMSDKASSLYQVSAVGSVAPKYKALTILL